MPSPFPGMDPYIEDSGIWEDFHDRFITYCGDQLLDALGDRYSVRIQERITSVAVLDDEEKIAVADVGVSRPESYSPPNHRDPSATATIEPVTLEHISFEPLTESYIEIRRRPELHLVTVIELLSPSNKVQPGRAYYQAKRDALLAQYVHIVEIDLLMRGARLRMKQPLRNGSYFALVSRAERRFFSDVYGWTIRQPLPTIPIPLLEPEPDYMLDLSALFRLTYDRGRYDRELNYNADPPSFLRPEDREWAREILSKPT